jgi:hypothetical protein
MQKAVAQHKKTTISPIPISNVAASKGGEIETEDIVGFYVVEQLFHRIFKWSNIFKNAKCETYRKNAYKTVSHERCFWISLYLCRHDRINTTSICFACE